MTMAKEEAIIPTRSDWLGKRKEAALHPELAIVDSHHHLWSRGGEAYLLPEFLEDTTSGHRIVATVYMECHSNYRTGGMEHLQPVGEVEYACKIAEESEKRPGSTRVCAGIVGSTDLRQGDHLQEVLEAMVAAGRGRFRGIRQIAAWHPDPSVKGTVFSPAPGLLLDPGLRRGMKVLAAKGLSFETWALHTQLIELYDLASACPDVAIVMNHAGGAIGMGLYAGRRDLAFAEWRSAIQTLAKAPNVFAKIGGFGMRVWGFGFHQQPLPPSSEELAVALRPYVETCVEAFGPARCMFESNFPPDKGSFSYVNLWNAYKRIMAKCSADEQRWLFRGTAEHVYHLGT
jgi:predicted TIM-barrel fold metal-dependent hydrolase